MTTPSGPTVRRAPGVDDDADATVRGSSLTSSSLPITTIATGVSVPVVAVSSRATGAVSFTVTRTVAVEVEVPSLIV